MLLMEIQGDKCIHILKLFVEINNGIWILFKKNQRVELLINSEDIVSVCTLMVVCFFFFLLTAATVIKLLL